MGERVKKIICIGLIIFLIASLIGCQPIEDGRNDDAEASSNSQMMGTTEDGPSTEESVFTEGSGATEEPVFTEEPTDTEGPIDTEEPTDTEEPIDTEVPEEPLPTPEDDELVKVQDYIPTIVQELRYRTVNNFTGKIIYDFDDAYLRYGTVKKLAKACEELAKHGLGIKIWDAFRPVQAQAALWEICPDPNFVSHPKTGTRAHCKGSAVDITLIDLETGQELPMPSGFDEFSAQGDRDYSDCSQEAAKNAKLLEDIMKDCGFKPYSKEWWHFSDTDSYPVEESFVPGTPTVWYANCEEYINLRTEADNTAKSIAKIYAGEEVELKAWDGRFALVTYRGKQGYVMSSYLCPVEERYIEENIDLVEITEIYSYEQMLLDIKLLKQKYPNLIETEVVGKSEQGRDIPVLRIGNENAKYHVLFQGSIHGREYITTWLLMALVDYWMDNDLMAYGDVCYHILPMTNPDGVVISQTQALDEFQAKIYQNDRKKGYTEDDKTTYAARWKANALGVDINRNFSPGWENIDDRNAPSAEQFRGETPFSSAEARVLRDYTLKYSFDATISYHSKGSYIYHGYGSGGDVNKASEELALTIEEVSGYFLKGDLSTDAGGYKDWAVAERGIPSVTVEVGCQDAPLAEREIYSIFARNYRVLPAIALWLQE